MTTWTPRPPHPDEPVCWSWPLPEVRTRDEEIDRLMAADHPEPPERPLSRGAWRLVVSHWDAHILGEWHADRCAICGVTGRHLVEDHCHVTGLVRGWCCRSCNFAEGIGSTDGAVLYRKHNPATILGVRVWYVGRGWLLAWWTNPQTGRALTDNPAWTVDIALGATRPTDGVDLAAVGLLRRPTH